MIIRHRGSFHARGWIMPFCESLVASFPAAKKSPQGMSAPHHEMKHYYDVSYGAGRQLIVRMVGVSIGAVLMYLYTFWLQPFAWMVGYMLAHLVHYLHVRAHLEEAEPRDLTVAGLIYLVVVVSFLWWPVFIATQDDPIRIYVGCLLIGSTVVYQIRRGDRFLWVNWGQILLFGAAIFIVLFAHMHRFDGALAKVGAVLVTVAALVFVAMAMLYTRSARLAVEEAAERLAQDQKMSAIGRLAGGVAHDFNNMLTVVLGNLELFHLMDDESEKQAAVTEAQAAAKRAEAVVHHLLIYARKAPVRRVEVDANAAMTEIMSLVQTMVPERVRLVFTQARAPLMIEVDETQLTTAVLNLVKNAVDAIEGSGVVEVSTRATEVHTARHMVNGQTLARGRYAEITVSDSGSGIPKELLSKVVEPFFTTKPTGRGTGLGLSMVVGFVQELEGGVDIESTNRGTRVRLYLPLR